MHTAMYGAIIWGGVVPRGHPDDFLHIRCPIYHSAPPPPAPHRMAPKVYAVVLK